MSQFRAEARIPVLALLLVAAAPVASLAAPGTPAAPGIDRSVRPGDDFYTFANGPWLKATALPAGRPRYGSSLMLVDRNAERVRALIRDAAAGKEGQGNAVDRGLAQRIGDYYAARMDSAAIEARGTAPLAGDLAAIAAIADRKALSAWLGGTLRPDDGANTHTEGIFGAWIHQGFHQADRYVPHLVQGGLGLADRDDYLDPAPAKAERRDLYRAHVAAILKRAGFADPEARAERILALEIAIARAHASRADTDDLPKTDNSWRRADFDARAAGMDWTAYFKAAGMERQVDFVVWQPSAVIGTSALVAGQPLEAWKDYLAFHLIDHFSAVLPAAFREAHDSFAGAPPADAESRAIAATDAAMGEAIGQFYVAHYFPPRAKAAATEMVENLRAAYRARLAASTWMSPKTKEKALAKLAALRIGLGYPEHWIDYSPLVVARGDALGNLRRAEDFAWRLDLAKLDRPVDPAEWVILHPQMVNAFLYFTPNATHFAAGVLQPPYFDYDGDSASNYGSAGAGIGHEMSHSFDELGNLYDARGSLGNWWSAQDLARYRAMTAPVAAQFDTYCPRPGLCLKGKQVQSESVADLTGLQIAHDAYLRALHGRAYLRALHGRPDAVIGGLTGEQRFFLAFARRWRMLQTEDSLRQQVATDTHPPGEYRSDTVRNVDAWYEAFGIKPGDKLYLKPEDRVRIW
jgi:putative endopeptidase